MKSFQVLINNRQITFDVDRDNNEYRIFVSWNSGSSTFSGTSIMYNGKSYLVTDNKLPEVLKGCDTSVFLKNVDEHLSRLVVFS